MSGWSTAASLAIAEREVGEAQLDAMRVDRDRWRARALGAQGRLQAIRVALTDPALDAEARADAIERQATVPEGGWAEGEG